jgi:hypothetical protein
MLETNSRIGSPTFIIIIVAILLLSIVGYSHYQKAEQIRWREQVSLLPSPPTIGKLGFPLRTEVVVDGTVVCRRHWSWCELRIARVNDIPCSRTLQKFASSHVPIEDCTLILQRFDTTTIPENTPLLLRGCEYGVLDPWEGPTDSSGGEILHFFKVKEVLTINHSVTIHS